jgi:hypothetical protein
LTNGSTNIIRDELNRANATAPGRFKKKKPGVAGNFVECRVLFDCNCRILLLFACFIRRRRRKETFSRVPLDDDTFFVVAQYNSNNTAAEGGKKKKLL